MQIAYLNGEYLPLTACKISALDRGFIFGDGVYEMIPVYDSIAFKGQEHLTRLLRSCQAVAIENPHSDDEWGQIIGELIRRSGDGDHALYLQVTRGCAPRDHYIDERLQPTVFGMTMPLIKTSEASLEQGIAAVTAEDIRWKRCDIKTISLEANVLLKHSAVEAGAQESILLRDGSVTEAVAANVFLVCEQQNQDILLTPLKDQRILPGITRELIIELAHQHSVIVEEREVAESELYSAKEIWLTSSTKEIVPVTKLNGNLVGEGKAGPLWKQFRQWLTQIKS